MFRTCFFPILLAVLFLSAFSFAGTSYVGTCHLPSYATISQAVSSVPPGSTIKVCPGTYPEQVLIIQPLTLEGYQVGQNAAAVVVAPAGGVLTLNTQDVQGNQAYPQILVQNTTAPVNITNLVVDGTGASPYGGMGYVVGIYFQSASGSITDSTVRNQVFLESSVGIYADGSGAAPALTVKNNVVNGQDWFGISMAGLSFSNAFTPVIESNFVDGSLARDGIILQWSSGTVSLNTVTNSMQLYASTATVTSNTLFNGLALQFDDSTVSGNVIASGGVLFNGGTTNLKGNKIDGNGGVGINLDNYGGLGPGKIESNTIVNTSTAVNGCGGVSPPTGYTVINNTIIDANIGLQMAPGNTTSPNHYYGTGTATAGCS